jgi:hypothetical protein
MEVPSDEEVCLVFFREIAGNRELHVRPIPEDASMDKYAHDYVVTYFNARLVLGVIFGVYSNYVLIGVQNSTMVLERAYDEAWLIIKR